MEKVITKEINGKKINFIIATNMTIGNTAVHINVRVAPDFEDSPIQIRESSPPPP